MDECKIMILPQLDTEFPNTYYLKMFLGLVLLVSKLSRIRMLYQSDSTFLLNPG